MLKVMFDTNANDAPALDPEYRELLIWAQDQKKIELFTTHIQMDQIDAIKDLDKRQIVYAINVSAGTTTTYGFIVGLSRLDWASFAPAGTLEKYLGNKKRINRNLTDALIASTAEEKMDIFVTDDSSLISKTHAHIKTFRSPEFKGYLAVFKEAQSST